MRKSEQGVLFSQIGRKQNNVLPCSFIVNTNPIVNRIPLSLIFMHTSLQHIFNAMTSNQNVGV